MSVIVSGRHVQVTDAIRKHAEDKFGAILVEYPKITSIRVILDIQKAHQSAEVIIHGKHLEIEATHQSYDMYESIDQIADKAIKQLHRHFEKVQDHHKPSKHLGAAEAEADEIPG
jgi:putative sigma-54 modulation protein